MFENDLEAYCLFVDVVSQLHFCELCVFFNQNSYFLIICLSMSFALILRHSGDKMMYHFEGRIACHNEYYISRDI